MQRWIVSCLIITGVTNAGRRGTGEIMYTVNFQKSIDSCEGFTNNVLDMSELEVENESPTISFFKGNVKVLKTIEMGTQVEIEAFKEMGPPVGREFLYVMNSDLCEQITDKTSAWGTIFTSMGVSGCPVVAKDYVIETLKFDLDYAKDMLRHEYTGDYYAKLSLIEPPNGLRITPNTLSCHAMTASLHETKTYDDQV